MKLHPGKTLRTRPRHQQGAAALEFALVFVIFFAVLYGIVSYSMMMLLQQGLTQAAVEGARASIRLDPLSFTSSANYETAVDTLAKDAALKALAWLPTKARNKVTENGNVVTSWVNSSKPITTGRAVQTIITKTLTVTVRYPNYVADPLLPVLTLPGIGPVPAPPSDPTASPDIVGKASLQLQL